MKIEGHKERLKESAEIIEEAIQGDITKRQMSIGFHTSVAAANFLEAYLHMHNLADYTFRFQHNWMKSKKMMIDRLPYEFQNKEKIIDLLYQIEKNRDKLCYGKPQPEELVIEQIELFNRLKETFREMGINGL